MDEQHLQQMKDEIKAAHDAEVKEYEARKAEYEAAVAAAAEAENEANAENRCEPREQDLPPGGRPGAHPPYRLFDRPEEGGGQLPEMPVEPPEPAYPKHGGLDKLLIDMEVSSPLAPLVPRPCRRLLG